MKTSEMHKLLKEPLEDMGAEVKEQLKAIKERRTYKGSDPDYRNRAREALILIGHFVKLAGTFENARTNDLTEFRLTRQVSAIDVPFVAKEPERLEK